MKNKILQSKAITAKNDALKYSCKDWLLSLNETNKSKE